MSRLHDHLTLANKNHHAIVCLLDSGRSAEALVIRHPEWIATIAFYKAIHIVEAIFISRGIVSSTDHNNREEKLKTRLKDQALFRDYKALDSASRVARYLSDGSKSSGKPTTTYRTFDDYIKPDDVVPLLLKDRLSAIEKSAQQHLPQADFDTLSKIEPAISA